MRTIDKGITARKCPIGSTNHPWEINPPYGWKFHFIETIQSMETTKIETKKRIPPLDDMREKRIKAYVTKYATYAF